MNDTSKLHNNRKKYTMIASLITAKRKKYGAQSAKERKKRRLVFKYQQKRNGVVIVKGSEENGSPLTSSRKCSEKAIDKKQSDCNDSDKENSHHQKYRNKAARRPLGINDQNGIDTAKSKISPDENCWNFPSSNNYESLEDSEEDKTDNTENEISQRKQHVKNYSYNMLSFAKSQENTNYRPHTFTSEIEFTSESETEAITSLNSRGVLQKNIEPKKTIFSSKEEKKEDFHSKIARRVLESSEEDSIKIKMSTTHTSLSTCSHLYDSVKVASKIEIKKKSLENEEQSSQAVSQQLSTYNTKESSSDEESSYYPTQNREEGTKQRVNSKSNKIKCNSTQSTTENELSHTMEQYDTKPDQKFVAANTEEHALSVNSTTLYQKDISVGDERPYTQCSRSDSEKTLSSSNKQYHEDELKFSKNFLISNVCDAIALGSLQNSDIESKQDQHSSREHSVVNKMENSKDVNEYADQQRVNEKHKESVVPSLKVNKNRIITPICRQKKNKKNVCQMTKKYYETSKTDLNDLKAFYCATSSNLEPGQGLQLGDIKTQEIIKNVKSLDIALKEACDAMDKLASCQMVEHNSLKWVPCVNSTVKEGFKSWNNHKNDINQKLTSIVLNSFQNTNNVDK